MDCLKLMGEKIAVSQSTSGDMPESGLDVLNETSGDTIEVALAKELLSAPQAFNVGPPFRIPERGDFLCVFLSSASPAR